MKSTINCPICNSIDLTKDISVIDHFSTQEEFTLLKCSSCDFKITFPQPDEYEFGKYYDSSKYISHSDNSDGIINKLYRQVKKFTILSKKRLIEGFAPNKNILDIGCGSGDFIGFLKQHNWQISGVEPSKDGSEMCMKKYNFSPYKELKEIQENQFGTITLWHVLEHVETLDDYFTFFKTHLHEKGKLIIALPSFKSFDAKHYGSYWAAYDVPRHLWHFSPKSIEKLASQKGFKQIAVFPMWFDSFYVSMLSEKYKSGGNIFKAILVGLYSNIQFLLNRHSCSSQIYIFEKNNE